MTPVLKVLTQYCDVYVDDIRLSEMKNTNPPLYANRMWGYLRTAIPLFNVPAEMQRYFFGTETNPNFTEPVFASTNYTPDGTEENGVSIVLGEEYRGYDLFQASVRRKNHDGTVSLLPYVAEYNSETGTVTLGAPIGVTLVFDFYKDGCFSKDLTAEQMNILGLFFNVVWTMRFNQDWLSNVSKIEDGTFKEQNRANKMNADTERYRQVVAMAIGEMRRYEQNVYYRKIFPSGNGLNL